MYLLRPSFICRLLALVAALTFSFSLALAAEPAQKTTAPAAVSTAIPDPVALVNGKKISASELKRARVTATQRGVTIPPDKEKEFTMQALNQLISAELLYNAGKNLEVKDLDKMVDAKIAQGKSRFSNEKDFAKALAELELTEKDLREYTRRDMVITNFVTTTIVPKITVTEAETRKFYDQNIEKFRQDEMVRASHILCGVDAKASDEEKKKAREKAESLRRQLAEGADFAKLARENSTCPSAQQGGDLGFFGKGQMVPQFDKVAFDLKVGQMSDVVETQFGFHIIKLTEKKSPETLSFSTVRPKLEEYLKNQKIVAAVVDYVAELRKTAKVEVFLK